MMDPLGTIPVRRKAFAYITFGTRLLLFTHPDVPEAGIQVPAGTMEAGESPIEAVLREATEETGLTDLRVVRWIGRALFDARPYGRHEFNDRWFFHLECGDSPPETWEHGEHFPSDGSPGPILFRFFWVDLASDVPDLTAGHDRFIPELRRILAVS
jgi:8-oxo-dGTP pyrophosphatase MutT (NUDIX family)